MNKSKLSMKLIIDSNDFKSVRGIERHLKTNELEYEVRPLDTGDYMWETEPKIIIERKTMGDLIGSIRDNHVQSQLLRMKAVTPYNYIIIVGHFNEVLFNPELIRLGYNLKMILSAEATLSIAGAKLLFCENHSQMFAIIKKMLQKFEKKDEPILLQDDLGFKIKELGAYGRLLTCIPSIAVETAIKIKSIYPTLPSLMKALENKTLLVDGVGNIKLKKIEDFINEINGISTEELK
jgi:ERCC4-type nuclease